MSDPSTGGRPFRRQGRQAIQRERGIEWLVLSLSFCLVVPVLDIPLFGLSASAPLFCFVAIDCLLRPRDWRPYRRWILLAVVFAAGVLFSLTGNVLLGNLTAIDGPQVAMLVRFFYWILVFVVAMTLGCDARSSGRIATTFAIGVLALGSLRLIEAGAFGYWGSGNPRFLSQNDYGWGFSAFTPFATWLLIQTSGWKKIAVACGWLALMLAVLGNGSRSSWVAILAGLLLLSLLYAVTRTGSTRPVLLTLALLGGLLTAAFGLAPARVQDPIAERAATLDVLARDKPWLSRQLLFRKGLRLFFDNPAFGTGLGGFTHVELAAAIVPVANYRQPARFGEKTPHNAYIQALAETGLAGSLPLLALLAALACWGPKAAVARAKAGETWALPLLTGCACMSLHFWTLSGLTSTAAWFLFGLLAGVIVRDRTGRSHGFSRGRT